jgi:diguanylate cyclase (GGDEF)-like protein
MIDLDKFKTVNDQHGHPVGDEVLVAVAGSIKQIVGLKGKSYRYGGEELCILLSNYTAEEGAALAERIRTRIEQVPISSKKLQITASFGVAELPAHARTAADLVEKADEALYQAKKFGRNLVRISGEPPPAAPGPRVPTRRQPEPGGLSDEQGAAIRTAYFKHGFAKCPHDGSRLDVEKSQPYDRSTPDLLVSCPLCGLSADLEGPS